MFHLRTLTSACIFIICIPSFAQTASDALEKGFRVKKGENVYLYFDGTSLKYDVTSVFTIINENAAASIRPDFTTLEDSTLFLVSSPFNVKMVPLNPLNFSYSNNISFVPDPIDVTFNEAISSIIGTVSKYSNSLQATESLAKGSRGKIGDSSGNKCKMVNYLLIKTDSLSVVLKDDYKDPINELFGQLKSINFRDFNTASTELAAIQMKINTIEKYYTLLSTKLKTYADSVPKITCGKTALEKFIVKKTFKDVHNELNTIYTAQVTRFGNLKNAYKLVNETYKTAKANDGYVNIDDVTLPKGKVKYLEVTVNTSGYQLSDAKEIIKVETKSKTKRSLVFQLFRRFVPEIAAGVAYADLDFPQYLGSTDSLGVTRVAKGASEVFNQLTFDVMVNFNYYIPNSNLLPFIQIGVGSNSDFPTLFTGMGIRINDGSFKRISISTGFAGTWVQTLDSLIEGQVVNEAKDVEDDITYNFSWGSPYFGIQYNF